MIGSAQTPEAEDEISDILEGSEQQKQDESEADDDVERELARSISPPVTSPRARSPNQSKSGKAKPKLAMFDTRGAAPDENTNKSLGDSWGGSSEKSIKSEIADSESLESPPLSPDGFGYVPTAVENKDRPSAGHKDEKDQEKSEPKSANDSKVKRKTGMHLQRKIIIWLSLEVKRLLSNHKRHSSYNEWRNIFLLGSSSHCFNFAED